MSKIKLLKVYLDKKYLIPFRLVMLLVSLPFVIDIYVALDTGFSGGRIAFSSGEFGYYSYISKKAAFSAFFLWLASFGSKIR